MGVVQIIGKWDNPVERTLFVITEGVIITVFSFFNFGRADMLYTTDAEFYIITIAFGLEFFYEAYKYIRWLQTCGSPKVGSDSPSMIPMESREHINYQDGVEGIKKKRSK